MTSLRSALAVGFALGLLALAVVPACSLASRSSDSAIKVTGSDTMVNLANAWSEAFNQSHPDIALQVKGGGSGVGIKSLISGKTDVTTSSRPMKPKEIEEVKASQGKEPKEFIVGRDALALYVHPTNPIESISIPELAEMYGEGGKISNWKDLGIDNPGCASGEIILVSRQNSSGTYAYFREASLGETREYKQGAPGQSGSSDVVALVSKTPCAIGYSGMAYKTPEVKFVSVSKQKGDPAIAPTLENTLDGSYPIARPLYLYTLGEPTGATAEFIQWVMGPEGQKVVEEQGYVPNPKASAGE